MIQHIKQGSINPDTDFEKELNILIFYTAWCGPWQEYGKVVSEISSVYPDIAFYLVDAEENLDLKRQFQIHKVPVSLFYKKNQLFSVKTGLIPKLEFLSLIQVLRN